MYQFINDISVLSVLLPILAALRFYRTFTLPFKILAYFFFISGIFDLALVLLVHYGWSNNAPIIHLFVLVNIVFLGLVYYKTFSSPLVKKLVMFLVPAIVILSIITSIFIEGIWAFPTISNSAQSVLFIFLSLLYFYQLLTRQEFVHIEKQGLFWINAGVLIYFSSNIFLFMLYNRIIDSHEWNLWIIHSVTNIVANVLYTIGLICKPQTPASYQYSL